MRTKTAAKAAIWCLVLAFGVQVIGCGNGLISDPTGGREGTGRGGISSANDASGNGAAGNGGDPNAPGDAPFTPAPSALRKLTVEQYRNSVQDLFGADIQLPSDLEADTAVNGFYAIGAAKATVSPSAVEKLENAAYALAAQVLDAKHRAAFVGCTPSGVTDDTCTRAFLTRFGKRAFRRPLSDEELTRYAGVATNAQTTLSDYYGGLEFAVAGVLQSPNFLFRVELGESDPANASRLRYDSYEMATRLSYALWNTTPDAELLAAADGDELVASAGLAKQVERLLASPRLPIALDSFHAERLGLDQLATLEKSPTVYGALNDGLRSAMREDVLRTFAEQTFGSDTDLRNVFDTRTVFVNDSLAAFYDLPAGTAGSDSALTRAELPANGPRAGLLGKVAYLALNAHTDETSPTLRGKYIRERILCEAIPAPPPNVITVIPEPNPNAATMRERLASHKSGSCATCHDRMDPLGLALEHFDGAGRYRDDDHGHALDTTGELDGASFDGALELGALLHDDPRVTECLARHAYRYAVGHLETPGEAAVIAALNKDFEQHGYQMTALLRAVVQSDGFRFAGGAQP